MKTQDIKSFFKQVKNQTSAHYGKKRPDLVWKLDALEAQDIATQDADKLAVIVNDALEKFGKQQLLDKSENWEFTPEGKVSVESLYDAITAETTRTRVVTKESLAKAGAFYADTAHLIGKLPPAAQAGNAVISAKLQPIVGQTEALKVFLDTLIQFVNKVAESEETDIMERFLEVIPVYEYLIKELKELITASEVNLAESL